MRAPNENISTIPMIKKLINVLNRRYVFLTFRFSQLISVGYEAGCAYKFAIL